MKKIIILLLFAMSSLMSQGVVTHTFSFSVPTQSPGAYYILSPVIAVPLPQSKSSSSGSVVMATFAGDTINANNSVRLQFFSDSVGLSRFRAGDSLVWADTMKANLRGYIATGSVTSGYSYHTGTPGSGPIYYGPQTNKFFYMMITAGSANSKWKYIGNKQYITVTVDNRPFK